jgi:UDP-3-O-[3-hydroxymyristoyl] glucosamine N-acyltransferase
MGADPRFFERLGPLSATQISDRFGFELIGDGSTNIADISTPTETADGCLCFLSATPKDQLSMSPGCVLVIDDTSIVELVDGPSAFLIADNARAAFGRVCEQLFKVRTINGSVAIDPSADIDESAVIGPNVAIGADAVVGHGAKIGAGAVIGPGVIVGAGTRIGYNSVVQCTTIGENAELMTGAVIGDCGFGIAGDSQGMLTMPHLGRVVLGDEVLIGACTTIDRGMIGDTVIGNGVRLDNHCHIGHNCTIGEYAVMAAFGGVSGSVSIGAFTQCGGRVGIADHVNIGSGVKLAAVSAVMSDIPDNVTYGGAPAQPIKSWMREMAWLRRQTTKKRNPKS